jgi:hypothetical protein
MNTNNKELINRFKLPLYIQGKSFADASKAISDKFKGRNDMISNNTKNELLKRLADAQEYSKTQPEQSNQMAGGGFADSTIGQAFGDESTGAQKTAALGAGVNTLLSGVDLAKTAFGKSNIDTSGQFASTSVDSGAMIGGAALKGASAGMAFGPIGAGVGALVGGIAGVLGSNKAKKATNENTNNFATVTNRRLSDNYFAMGGEIDPLKITKNQSINNSIVSNTNPTVQSDRFKYAVGEQGGVQHGTSGEAGHYLYYGKKPGDAGFNPNINREFVNQNGYNTYMNSPQGQQYRRNLNTQTNQPIEQLSYGGEINKYVDGGPFPKNYKDLNILNNYGEDPNTIQSIQDSKKLGYHNYKIGDADLNGVVNSKDVLKKKSTKTNPLDFLKNNSDLLRYAPAVTNALQLKNLKKPTNVSLDKLGNRYKPNYVDLAQQQNIVNQELNNVNSAIQQSGASQGQSRAAMLASQLNKTKALSNAYMNAEQQNAQQDAAAQQFNLGVDQVNLQQSNSQQDINDRNMGAYDTQKSNLISGIAQNLNGIGKEEFYKKAPERMGLIYDYKGNPINGAYKDKQGNTFNKEGVMIYDKDGKEVVNKSAKGGYLNQNVLDHINTMYTKRNNK